MSTSNFEDDTMVCSIAAGASASYYLRQVEYYADGSGPGGIWLTADGSLGVNDGDVVDAAALETLMSGRTLTGETRPTSGRDDDRSAWDLTFSAPKSVSILAGAGDDALRQEIDAAHDAAVRAALSLLDREAGFARRGRGGKTLEKVSLTAAVFREYDARPAEHADGSIWPDPNLHSHCAVPNMARRADGSLGAIDGRHLLKWKMAAGATYRAELAARLQRMGFTVEPVDDRGLWELAEIPERIRRHFSARRDAIEKAALAEGLNSALDAKHSAKLALETRTHKQSTGIANLREHWRAELAKQEFSICRVTAPVRDVDLDPSEKHKQAALQAVEHVSEFRSVFEKRHLVEAVALNAVPIAMDAAAVSQEVERLIAEGSVVELSRDALDRPVFSTRDMIEIEREIQTLSQDLAKSTFATPDQPDIEERCRRYGLSIEQTQAAMATTGASALALAEGRAGVGKTTLLKPMVDHYQARGFKVVGMATSWKVAHALKDDLNIDARATDAWFADAARGEKFLDTKTVLVVDEAGQLGSRATHKILSAARAAGAKLILVGDRQQLQPIAAGAGMDIIASAEKPVQVRKIVRQRDAWARKMVSDFAVGNAKAAIAALREHEGIAFVDRSDDAVKLAVDRWQAHRGEGLDLLLLAKSNAEVRALNVEVRARLRHNRTLSGDDHVVRAVQGRDRPHELRIAVGEKLRFTRRINKLGVINGTTATVERVTQTADGQILIRLKINDRRVELSAAGSAGSDGALPIAHDYAATIYRSQGMTVDRAVVLASPSLDRHDAYVAASRARTQTELLVCRRSVDAAIRARTALNRRDNLKLDDPSRFAFLVERFSEGRIKETTLEFSQPESPLKPTPILSRGVDIARRSRASQKEIDSSTAKLILKPETAVATLFSSVRAISKALTLDKERSLDD